MEANELRLGNIIYSLGQKHEGGKMLGWINYEVPVDLEVLQNIILKNTYFAYSPIPLTEERLLEFGFEKEFKHFQMSAEIFAFVKSEIYLHFIDGECWLCEEYDSNLSKMRKLKGVHDLQNLYFAIKGEELTI